MAAFLGTIFVWEKWLPQSHRGQAPARLRQGGNVRVAAPYHVEFLFQNEYASYTGRSGRTSLCSRRSVGRGFFQLQKQTCQKLWPLSALEFEARLLLPSFSSKMNMPLTQVALVARPCAPAAQWAEDSSSSRSRLAKSYGRLAPLSLKQDCFFRVPLPKLKCLVQFAFGGQRDFRPPLNSPKAPFRQLSKVADASQPL